MNTQLDLFNFNAVVLPNITVFSAKLSTAQHRFISFDTVKDSPIDSDKVITLAFVMSGGLETNYTGIPLHRQLTKHTHNFIYAPSGGHFRIHGPQQYDSFAVAVRKDFFMPFVDEGNDWFEGIIRKMDKQDPFSLSKDTRPTSARIQLLIEQVRARPASGSLQKLYLQSKINDLLYTYFREADTFSYKKNYEDLSMVEVEKLYELKQYLLINFLQEHNLESLARLSNLNLFKLKQGFKRVHGLSVFEYLRQLRMEYAPTLLRDTPLNVGEVALQLGYSHLNHFSTAFKKHFGQPPTAWK